ncbi:MAG: type I 3-dehydroquinate dehydratase [Ramlibacter sp.]|nr:type I 3-dehydroquinate dehydratase [Ramlibacter sp.]
MPSSKPIRVGQARFPAICAPLVARTREAILEEVKAVAHKRPDILEWRVDFFEGIGDAQAVVEVAAAIREAAPGIALLLTRRSAREGGQTIGVSEEQVIDMYRAACASGHIDLVDYEMSNGAEQVAQVRAFSKGHGVQLVLSFHDFSQTPDAQELATHFVMAQRLGADVAKVAVMPRDMDDVIVLLKATLDASRGLEIPVVSMAMGSHGAVSRVCGFTFGSAMTFAVGQNSSAPGQMPIEDVQAGIEMLQRAL